LSTKDTVRGYYEAWAAQDREAVRSQLDSALSFRSPQDSFESAEAFLSACWRFSSGLKGVSFVTEVYDDARAFVVLRWLNDDGSTFEDAEYVEVSDGVISRILVVNNSAEFGGLLDQ
jgi:hypothetical protein